MTRDEVLKGVSNNYRRFYFKKATGGYLWDRDPYRRKYLRGCLKAYLKSAMERLILRPRPDQLPGPALKVTGN
ncbi:MAG: hypothetical protein R2882_12985 [Gemmatimonadales bacterium]